MKLTHKTVNPIKLAGQFICRSCKHVQAEPFDCPHCGNHDDFALIIHWQEARTLELLTDDQARARLKASAAMLAEYERLGLLHPQHVAYENALVSDYDPKEIDRLGTNAGEHSVVPGIITQHEFRVRYGYQCKRVPCTFCQQFHYCGSNDAKRTCWSIAGSNNAASGTRYRVSRAHGTGVAIELSARQAWYTAYQHEQARFVPILVARDALSEGRIPAALEIAEQLPLDLGIPLRHEIARAMSERLKRQAP